MRQSIAPMDETRYGPEEFEGIVSETLMRTLDSAGATRLMWRKIARANEPLDVLVYSLALVSHLGGLHLAEADAIANCRRTEGRMSRTLDVFQIEFGGRTYAPPAGAAAGGRMTLCPP